MKIRIEHVAYWVEDLESVKGFYETYFDATSGDRYENKTKGFKSYFLTLGAGARIEIMQKSNIEENNHKGQIMGLAHIALSLGSKRAVDQFTQKMQAVGIPIVGKPRTTGDGYYESVIADPEGNLIELTV
ncbi:MAG: VOC family protein [Cytophagales bacterium]|nr:VOC family protein [Cytophagales bacterium]